MNPVYSINTQSDNRKFPVGYTTAYRFGFNGQEKLNETYGDNSTYDFGNRIIDSRLGRWLSLDSRMSKYPDISPYCFAENNPIIMVDEGGDSTKYYSSSGRVLHTSYDGLENAIVIVDDEDVQCFTNQLKVFKKKKEGDGNGANEALRKFGKVYSLQSIETFYKNSKVKKNQIESDNIQGEEVEFVEDEQGKKHRLYREVIRNIVEENGIIKVGSKENERIGGSVSNGSPKNIVQEDADGTIHTHPNPRGDVYIWTKNGKRLPATFDSGESEPDSFSSKESPGRSIYVSDNEIGFYKYGLKTIKFDRLKRYKK